MNKVNKQRGFMQVVFLAIIIIVALAYFNIDIRTLIENPIVQKIWHIFVVAWEVYLKPLFTYLFTSFGDLFHSDQ